VVVREVRVSVSGVWLSSGGYISLQVWVLSE
jgi:hypothetical protein